MSVSGYTQDGFYYQVGDDYYPIVAEVAVSVHNAKVWEEIPIPCIVQRLYKLTYAISLDDADLRKLIPKKISKVSVEFQDSNGRLLKDGKVKKKKESKNIISSRIAGKCLFRIKDHCVTQDGLLSVVVNIHNVAVTLICDLAVFTNSNQITKNYGLAIANTGKKAIQDCFWYENAVFSEKPQKKIVKVKENVLAPPVSLSRQPLLGMVKGTEEALEKMKARLYDGGPFGTEDLAAIAESCIELFSQYLPSPSLAPTISYEFFPDHEKDLQELFLFNN